MIIYHITVQNIIENTSMKSSYIHKRQNIIVDRVIFPEPLG